MYSISQQSCQSCKCTLLSAECCHFEFAASTLIADLLWLYLVNSRTQHRPLRYSNKLLSYRGRWPLLLLWSNPTRRRYLQQARWLLLMWPCKEPWRCHNRHFEHRSSNSDTHSNVWRECWHIYQQLRTSWDSGLRPWWILHYIDAQLQRGKHGHRHTSGRVWKLELFPSPLPQGKRAFNEQSIRIALESDPSEKCPVLFSSPIVAKRVYTDKLSRRLSNHGYLNPCNSYRAIRKHHKAGI